MAPSLQSPYLGALHHLLRHGCPPQQRAEVQDSLAVMQTAMYELQQVERHGAGPTTHLSERSTPLSPEERLKARQEIEAWLEDFEKLGSQQVPLKQVNSIRAFGKEHFQNTLRPVLMAAPNNINDALRTYKYIKALTSKHLLHNGAPEEYQQVCWAVGIQLEGPQEEGEGGWLQDHVLLEGTSIHHRLILSLLMKSARSIKEGDEAVRHKGMDQLASAIIMDVQRIQQQVEAARKVCQKSLRPDDPTALESKAAIELDSLAEVMIQGYLIMDAAEAQFSPRGPFSPMFPGWRTRYLDILHSQAPLHQPCLSRLWSLVLQHGTSLNVTQGTALAGLLVSLALCWGYDHDVRGWGPRTGDGGQELGRRHQHYEGRYQWQVTEDMLQGRGTSRESKGQEPGGLLSGPQYVVLLVRHLVLQDPDQLLFHCWFWAAYLQHVARVHHWCVHNHQGLVPLAFNDPTGPSLSLLRRQEATFMPLEVLRFMQWMEKRLPQMKAAEEVKKGACGRGTGQEHDQFQEHVAWCMKVVGSVVDGPLGQRLTEDWGAASMEELAEWELRVLRGTSGGNTCRPGVIPSGLQRQVAMSMAQEYVRSRSSG